MELKRIDYLDTVRVFAIYWIVFFAHMPGYMSDEVKAIRTLPMYDITRSCLSVMMFISGYLLSKYKFVTRHDIFHFYKKRMRRFYIPFAVSAFTLFFMKFNPDVKVLFTTLLGLSSFILPQPGTLWFMSMLMLFYIITPLFSKLIIGNSMFFHIFQIILFTTILIICERLVPVDTRLHANFLSYSLGLVFGTSKILNNIIDNYYIGVIIIFTQFNLIRFRITGESVYDIDVVLGIFSLLFISKWMSFPCFKQILFILSYGSMALYLFHRQCFILFDYVYRHINNSDYSGIWYAITIMVPLSILFTILIQKLYDFLNDIFTNKIKNSDEVKQ